MLRQRTLVVIFLLPLGMAIIYWGGAAYVAFIALILGLAAWEYVNLYRTAGLRPVGVIVIGGVLATTLARAIDGFGSAPWILGALVLVSMGYHSITYERGRDQAAVDLGITLGGIMYIGWLGAYLISIRDISNGLWWELLVLPAVWSADTGAYFIGRRFGRHQFSPRLSPKKTWEGYFGGIVTGILGGALFAALWGIRVGPEVMQPWHGAVLGLVLAVITPLGDLGESMIKRQVGAKDSSNLIPGHGGMLDRIDSWLWAVTIGYYIVIWFFQR
jgi:phosphatidate cytidylyltransferase